MVAHPARDQLNWENVFSLSPFAPENLILRDRFGLPSRVGPPFSTRRLNLVLTQGISPAFRDGVSALTTFELEEML